MIESWEKIIDPNFINAELIGEVGKEVVVTTTASGRYFEVDEFHGDNDGLVMAEIELKKPDEPFDRPAWLGEEVTGDRRYYNSHLLLSPYKSWK